MPTRASIRTIRYQRRLRAKGLCVRCRQPLLSSCHCDPHRIAQNQRLRRRRAEMGAEAKASACRGCGQAGHNIATCWRRKELSRAQWEAIVREKARAATRLSMARKREARRAFLLLLWSRAQEGKTAP